MGFTAIRQRPSYKKQWLRSFANMIPQMISTAGSTALRSAIQGAIGNKYAQEAFDRKQKMAEQAQRAAMDRTVMQEQGDMLRMQERQRSMADRMREQQAGRQRHQTLRDAASRLATLPGEASRFQAAPAQYQSPQTRASKSLIEQIAPQMTGAMAGGFGGGSTSVESAQGPMPPKVQSALGAWGGGKNPIARALSGGEEKPPPLVPIGGGPPPRPETTGPAPANPLVSMGTRQMARAARGAPPGSTMERGMKEAGLAEQMVPEEQRTGPAQKYIQLANIKAKHRRALEAMKHMNAQQRQYYRAQLDAARTPAETENALNEILYKARATSPLSVYGWQTPERPVGVTPEVPPPPGLRGRRQPPQGGGGAQGGGIPPAPQGVNPDEWNRAIQRGIQKGLTPQQAAQAVMRHLGAR